MGKWRILFGLTLSLAIVMPALARDMRVFAVCTGRLSALMEHQWLMQDPGADRTKAQRDAFADLVQAVEVPGQARYSLALRIEAKAATAAVLLRAEFGREPRLRSRITAQIRSCLRLLPQV